LTFRRDLSVPVRWTAAPLMVGTNGTGLTSTVTTGAGPSF
jgi:hypothetical protein